MTKGKVILISTLAIAALFGAIALVFYSGDWKRFRILVLAGGFVGLLAAPEFEPKLFKNAWVYQLCSGVIVGGLIGFSFVSSPEVAGIGAVVGGLLGITASYWVKNVPVP